MKENERGTGRKSGIKEGRYDKGMRNSRMERKLNRKSIYTKGKTRRKKIWNGTRGRKIYNKYSSKIAT